MRQRRLKAPASFPVADYHCMSRVLNRDFVFGPPEREQFVRLLREYERFCGVRVLTFCILSNHFHLLVQVPARPAQSLSAEEVLARIEALSSYALTPRCFHQRLDPFRAAGDASSERAFLDRICATMWDISGYLQRLKQRFTQWFNRRQGRRGVLWEDRFKSVLVEGTGDPLSAMAAYIDLNPVRAGLVDDPKDYRWYGYGAAAAGDAPAREAIASVIAMAQRRPEVAQDPTGALATYRMWLFGQGEAREGTAPKGSGRRICPEGIFAGSGSGGVGGAGEGVVAEVPAIEGALLCRRRAANAGTDHRSVRAARPAQAGLRVTEGLTGTSPRYCCGDKAMLLVD